MIGSLAAIKIPSTWKRYNGLILELNVPSSSDTEHWFKNYHFASDSESYEDDDTSSAQGAGYRQHNNPGHGWVDGQQVMAPPKAAIIGLFVSGLDFHRLCAQVNTVPCLIIR